MNTYKIVIDDELQIHKRIEIAETPAKAKYQAFLYFSDVWSLTFREFLRLVTNCKKIGTFKPSDLYGDCEQFDRIKKARGIEFVYLGMRIEVCGKMGTIVGGNDGMNLDVVFDHKYHKSNCHPWYRTKYFDKQGNVVAEFGA